MSSLFRGNDQREILALPSPHVGEAFAFDTALAKLLQRSAVWKAIRHHSAKTTLAKSDNVHIGPGLSVLAYQDAVGLLRPIASIRRDDKKTERHVLLCLVIGVWEIACTSYSRKRQVFF